MPVVRCNPYLTDKLFVISEQNYHTFGLFCLVKIPDESVFCSSSCELCWIVNCDCLIDVVSLPGHTGRLLKSLCFTSMSFLIIHIIYQITIHSLLAGETIDPQFNCKFPSSARIWKHTAVTSLLMTPPYHLTSGQRMSPVLWPSSFHAGQPVFETLNGKVKSERWPAQLIT